MTKSEFFKKIIKTALIFFYYNFSKNNTFHIFDKILRLVQKSYNILGRFAQILVYSTAASLSTGWFLHILDILE